MQNRNDVDRVIVQHEENPKWKSANSSPAHIPPDRFERFRTTSNFCQSCFYRKNKFITQIGALILIPHHGARDIGFSLLFKDQMQGHFLCGGLRRKRRLTSGHEDPVG